MSSGRCFTVQPEHTPTTKRCAHICLSVAGCPRVWPQPGSPGAGWGGLIAGPAAEPVFVAQFVGAARPAWSPHDDPRVAALAAGYEFLLDAAARVDSVAGLALPGRGLR